MTPHPRKSFDAQQDPSARKASTDKRAAVAVRPVSVDDPQLRALLKDHIRDMYAVTPAESVHTLDFEALAADHVRLVGAFDGDTLLGCGAIQLFRENDSPAAELKSMRTLESARGQGVASAVLDELVAIARREDVTRLYLETGVEDYFAPARAFYLRNGFIECAPFADYGPDPLSVFMTRAL